MYRPERKGSAEHFAATPEAQEEVAWWYAADAPFTNAGCLAILKANPADPEKSARE